MWKRSFFIFALPLPRLGPREKDELIKEEQEEFGWGGGGGGGGGGLVRRLVGSLRDRRRRRKSGGDREASNVIPEVEVEEVASLPSSPPTVDFADCSSEPPGNYNAILLIFL